MSDWSRGEILQLFGIVSATAASLIGVFVSRQIKELHIIVNHRLDALLASARREGITEGRANP